MKMLSVKVLNGQAEYVKKSGINLSKYVQVRLDGDMQDDVRRVKQRTLAKALQEIATHHLVLHSDIGCVKINNVLLKNGVGDVDNHVYVVRVRQEDKIATDVAGLFKEVAIFLTEELKIYKYDTRDVVAQTIVAKRHEVYKDSRGHFYILSIN